MPAAPRPVDEHRLTDLEAAHSGTERIDPPGVLVAERERRAPGEHTGVEVVHEVEIGVAGPRARDPDDDLTGSWLRLGDVPELGWLLPGEELQGLHDTSIDPMAPGGKGQRSLARRRGGEDPDAMVRTGTTNARVSVLSQHARPITGAVDDYDALLELIGSKRVVLIGEASHGTHDFYRERARITRRLVDELGFNAVAVEADWPDAYRVNRYVMGLSDDADANESLSDFERFPAWMWRNRDVADFVEWARARNQSHRHPATRVRFFGLDLYSLRASMQAVVAYLDRVDPAEALRARERYACFDHVGAEGQAYGYALAHEGAIPCENEVVAQLLQLRRRSELYLRRDGWLVEDEQFFAEQNATLVRDAEEYYQQMYRAEVSSWNLRDRHMANTLDALLDHLEHQFGHAKIVVWEHNSHVGDARATAMGARGELTVGELARERHHGDTFLVGFTTNSGRVTAASDWGAPAERKHVRPALPHSHEALLHQVNHPSYWLALSEPDVGDVLREPRLERAIGVIYRPETERQSHYFDARLADQFDAVIHIDQTRALTPLETTALWDQGEPPETYPSGL
jgi:erythromycin esterase-like protein